MFNRKQKLIVILNIFAIISSAGCGPRNIESEPSGTTVQPAPSSSPEPEQVVQTPTAPAPATGDRPFDPPRPDSVLPTPLPVIFPSWPGIPRQILLVNPSGMSLDQLLAAAVTVSPVVSAKIHEIIAAIEERQLREDNIQLDIENAFQTAWAAYLEKIAAGETATRPFRRSFRRSEIEHLVDGDHLIAAAEFDYSKVAANQVNKVELFYTELLNSRAIYRHLLASSEFLEKISTLIAKLVKAGEIPASKLDEVSSRIAENDFKIAENRTEQLVAAEKLFIAAGLDSTAGPDSVADFVLPDPRRMTIPVDQLIDSAIGFSFEKLELQAELEAANSRIRKEQWILWENPTILPHPDQDHAVQIEMAAANILTLDITNLFNQIASEVTTLFGTHNSNELRFLAARGALNLRYKSYDDAEAAFINGERDYTGLIEQVEAVLDARLEIDLIRVSYLTAKSNLDRLRMSGVYQTLSFDWRDHP